MRIQSLGIKGLSNAFILKQQPLLIVGPQFLSLHLAFEEFDFIREHFLLGLLVNRLDLLLAVNYWNSLIPLQSLTLQLISLDVVDNPCLFQDQFLQIVDFPLELLGLGSLHTEGFPLGRLGGKLQLGGLRDVQFTIQVLLEFGGLEITLAVYRSYLLHFGTL